MSAGNSRLIDGDKCLRLVAIAVAALGMSVDVQAGEVTTERLQHADEEPQNWMMVNGTYDAHRFSSLDQINRANVGGLKVAFTVGIGGSEPGADWTRGTIEASPLVEDGFMYLPDGWSNIYKIDLRSGDRGRIVWKTDPAVDKSRPGMVPANRGVALYGNLVVALTNDGRVIGLNKETGRIVSEASVNTEGQNETFTIAPLVVRDKLIFGASNGDYGVRGWIAAFDLKAWKIAWRRFTIPAPGEPGSETWKDNHGAWKTGGGAVWVTGDYDPATNRLYYGTGNPVPMYAYERRPGDNLYSDSTLALDADTGQIAWFFQYTPNDGFDYDETGAHMLITTKINGIQRDLLSHFGRNGFYYGLDRFSGRFVNGSQFVTKLTWTKGLNERTGKPLGYDPARAIQTYNKETQPKEGGPIQVNCPDSRGGAEFWPPAFSPSSGLAYAASWEGCGETQIAPGLDQVSTEAIRARGGVLPAAGGTHTNRELVTGSLTSVDPATGKVRARYQYDSPNSSGATATAGHLVFTAFLDGTIVALDDETLAPLFTFHAGTYIGAPPIVYSVNGKEYMAILTGGPVPPRVAGPFANHDLFLIEASPVLLVFAL